MASRTVFDGAVQCPVGQRFGASARRRRVLQMRDDLDWEDQEITTCSVSFEAALFCGSRAQPS